MSVLARALLFLLVAMLASCGGMKEPDSPGAEEPQRVEDAEAALDRAERDLELALVEDRLDRAGEEDQAPAPAPAPRPLKQYGADEPHSAEQRRCSTACRALASMHRAANRLCDLAGSGDQRCGGARSRVLAARELVKRNCPSC